MFYIVERDTGDLRITTSYASEDDVIAAFGCRVAMEDFMSEECCMLEWIDDEITGEFEIPDIEEQLARSRCRDIIKEMDNDQTR